MFYTEIGLTQYEMHDKVSFLDRYNEDMRTITTTSTIASGEIKRVEADFADEVTRIDSNFEELDDKVDNIASKIPPIVASVSVASGRLDVVEMKTAGLEVTTTSISDKLIEHITTSTSVMAGIVEEIKAGDAALDLKIMADRERIAVNETKIAENAADIEALQNSDSALEPRVEANENAIDALRQVDSEQGQAIQTEHNTNVTQTSQIAGMLTNIQGLSAGMDNLRQGVEDLQTDVADLKNSTLTVEYRNGGTTPLNIYLYAGHAQLGQGPLEVVEEYINNKKTKVYLYGSVLTEVSVTNENTYGLELPNMRNNNFVYGYGSYSVIEREYGPQVFKSAAPLYSYMANNTSPITFGMLTNTVGLNSNTTISVQIVLLVKGV